MKYTFFLVLFFLCLVVRGQKDVIDLQDVVSSRNFKNPMYSGYPMPQSTHLYVKIGGNRQLLLAHSYATGEVVDTILNLRQLDPALKIYGFQISEDENVILFHTEKTKRYRRTFNARYYCWVNSYNRLTPITEQNLDMAVLSPQGNYIAYSVKNNLYVWDNKYSFVKGITKNGKENSLINGMPDWSYEEEFGLSQAIEWSPDERFIAYYTFEIDRVPNYFLTNYKQENGSLRPTQVTYKYPRAGDSIPLVSINVYDMSLKTNVPLNISSENKYIPHMAWSQEEKSLGVVVLDRYQRRMDILLYNVLTGEGASLYTESNKKYTEKASVKSLTFIDQSHFVFLSGTAKYNHLYKYNYKTNSKKSITKGLFEVTNYYGYDPTRNLFYYQTVGEHASQRAIYSTDTRNTTLLTTFEGTNQAQFNQDFTYFFHTYHNSTTPPQTDIRRINRGKSSSSRVKLQSNSHILENVEKVDMPTKEFISIPIEEGVHLNGFILRPKNFSQSKSYPMIITQYSGPGSQTVSDRWSVDFNTYLTTQGYIVVGIDPRGTGGKGYDFRTMVYENLGIIQAQDIVKAVRYLSNTLSYVDNKRIGIWGWSFGGTTSLLALGMGGTLFNCGVAVAPVTRWNYYDAIYTERYMNQPTIKPEAYERTSPFSYIGGMRGKLLLIHGAMDDNVHPINSYEFADSLVQRGVLFEMKVYPYRNHSISGDNTKHHVYASIADFFMRQFSIN